MSFIKDLIVAVAAIVTSTVAVVTATVAWKGLSRWKHEQAGKVHFEVARQLARATYRLRDAMNDARNSFTSAAEFPPDYDAMNDMGEEKAKAWAHVFTNRFAPLREAVSELQTMGLEAEVLWGDEVKQKVTALVQCVGLLRFAMQENVFYIAMSEEKRARYEKIYGKYEEMVHGSTDVEEDKGEFTERVRKALGDMQALLKAHLVKFRLEG
ncbi:hypothetical protein [Pinirhizobacter sp.]|uniref:hypothetical protein n=1 Tax=Pinirhizobacter sp. TaxID=2950432 RepID=UPI002F3EB875